MITRKQAREALKLARRGQLDLQAFIDSLASDYVRTQAELEGLVMEALLSGDLAKVTERRKRLTRVRRLLTALERRTPLKVRRIIREAVRLGERTTRTGTGESAPPNFGILRQQAVNSLSAELEGDLKNARETTGRRIETVINQEGLRAAAQAVSSDDENIVKASEAMRRRLINQGVTSFTDKAGRTWALDTYANMVVRTRATNAMAQGAENAMLGRNMDLVEIHSGEAFCPICEPFQGGPWSLTGRALGVPVLKKRPAYHPHCDCVITPSVDAFDERAAFEARNAA